MKPKGHYCKVCGQHKANEQFSGKGHSAHICKACARLTATEQAEAMTLTRLYNLPASRLSDSDKKWLENRTHDKRPAVQELAAEIYRMHFPYARRNALKKQLRINELEFSVSTCLWDEYGEEQFIRCQFALNRSESLLLKRPLAEDASPDIVELETKDTANLFKWMLHSLEIFCWDEDYCGSDSEAEPEADGLDFLNELFGGETEAPKSSESNQDDEPAWRVLLKYSDGHEQRIESFELGLPDRVEQLYLELNQYFADEDENDDEFDFLDMAYGCSDLTELAQLVETLLADAQESQSDALLATALMDLMSVQNEEETPPKRNQRRYLTHSGASASLEFLRSFLVQTTADELQPASEGRQRLRQFADYVKSNITLPKGELISPSDMDKILAAIEKKYGLISRLSETETLRILRISNTHLSFNSVCNAVRKIDGADRFRYEIYLFHCRDEDSGHPAYILLHEIGHALQVELTHDPGKIPESFCKMSDLFLGKPLEQGMIAPEIFADAFAIAMIRIFGWDEYGTFDEIDDGVKHTFTQYMDWLLEKEIVKAKDNASD